MDETLPDASPLSQRFLASLANFMESEHELLGEGDISSRLKVAMAAQASSESAESVMPQDAAVMAEPGLPEQQSTAE